MAPSGIWSKYDKLPDLFEELNQGAEKAFGDNAEKMIDSLLYAKLPPKLKRSVTWPDWKTAYMTR